MQQKISPFDLTLTATSRMLINRGKEILLSTYTRTDGAVRDLREAA